MTDLFKNHKEYVDNNIEIQFLNKLNDYQEEMCRYALNNGKRLRPIICIEIYKILNKEISDIIILSSIGIELLHNSSLIMDDLPCMDNDNYRRGSKTVHYKYGVKKANFLANFFICKSFEFLSKLNNKLLLELICKNTEKLCLGQYYDLCNKNNYDDEDVIDNISMKTYPLFSIPFLVGYIEGGGDISNYESVEKCSKYFSIMFQICDDMEDFDIDIKRGLGNEENINYMIYFGRDKTIELFNLYYNKFTLLMTKLNLYSELFKKICFYLKTKLKIYN